MKLSQYAKQHGITLIVVEHRARLTRFGFHYLETLLEPQGRKIEVVHAAEDLMADLVTIISSFTARLCP